MSLAFRSLVLFSLICGCSIFAEQVHPLTKRVIAPVMGYGGADWLERTDRPREERTDKALKALNLKPGMQIGDVGAGIGYYSLRMAHLVLPGGTVFANDIQPQMLQRLAANARNQSVNNIEEVQGTEIDCKLPESKLDLILLVDVYHEFSHPEEMLTSIRRALKPDGHVVLIEYRGEDPNLPIRPEHKMTLAQVKAEVVPQGFTFERSVESLPLQHIIFFRKSTDVR